MLRSLEKKSESFNTTQSNEAYLKAIEFCHYKIFVLNKIPTSPATKEQLDNCQRKLAHTYSLLALNFLNSNKFSHAAAHYKAAIIHLKKINQPFTAHDEKILSEYQRNHASVLNEMGLGYCDNNSFKKAAQYFQLAITALKEINPAYKLKTDTDLLQCYQHSLSIVSNEQFTIKISHTAKLFHHHAKSEPPKEKPESSTKNNFIK